MKNKINENAIDLFAKTHVIDHPPFSYNKATKLFKYLKTMIRFDEKTLTVTGCDGTLNKTAQWLEDNGYTGNDELYALCFLRNRGGYCDCEVLMNAAEPYNWK